ncbi:MAG: glutamine--fructose-6-phosphate transaminase (isomerizing) [Candidatus Thorarchaeota archaeon]|nr:MAG: glutamine--fructose-6-phosphate transaminase (isomerizing) [Candidatus Thorarchaeota archaeon]
MRTVYLVLFGITSGHHFSIRGSDLCGITGIVTKNRDDIGALLVMCSRKLTYRGYDSVGVAAVKDGVVDLRKDVGTIDEVDKMLGLSKMRGDRGIAQLRWATYGAPTKVNAQPHFGCTPDFYGAHNGNIHNYAEYRQELIETGHIVRSENDGELCVHAVDKYYEETGDMFEAVRLSTRDLKGAFAFSVGRADEEKIYAVKMGSSLVAGVAKDATIVSSDLPSILPLTNNVVYLRDREMVELTAERVRVFRIEDGKELDREPEISNVDPHAAEKGGYHHFMLKEINEQPKVAQDVMGVLEGSRSEDWLKMIEDSGRKFLVACGSSYNAGIVGTYYFNRLAGTPLVPVIGGQFIPMYGKSLADDSLCILVSQSGETKDIMNVLNLVKETGKGKTLGVVNVIGSTLMFGADAYIPMACGYEVSVPATKTYFSQTIIFAYLAARLGERNGTIDPSEAKEFIRSLAEDLPRLTQQTIDRTGILTKSLAQTLIDVKDLYCLGYGFTDGVAREGALKIKEICYNHCEGMYSSEFKHGPLSIVTDNYPVIFVTTREDSWMVINHINEVRARHGRTIVVGEYEESLSHYVDREGDFLTIPESDILLNPLLDVIPLQMLSYYLSVDLGINPDLPRNLSKTLTVD